MTILLKKRLSIKEYKYIKQYHPDTIKQVTQLIESKSLKTHLLKKYPTAHALKSDKQLFSYVNSLKNEYMKKASPLSKVNYDGKINVIHNALGTHHFISRVQGSKLKSKNEIRVASLFKNVPEAFLRMIVVHELAHFKEKEHNKSFYKLCNYIEPQYHQLEFDLRLYLTQIDLEGKIHEWS